MKKISLKEAANIVYDSPFNFFSDVISNDPTKSLDISIAKLKLASKLIEAELKYDIVEKYKQLEYIMLYIEYLEYSPKLYKTNIDMALLDYAKTHIKEAEKQYNEITEQIEKILNETYIEYEYA